MPQGSTPACKRFPRGKSKIPSHRPILPRSQPGRFWQSVGDDAIASGAHRSVTARPLLDPSGAAAYAYASQLKKAARHPAETPRPIVAILRIEHARRDVLPSTQKRTRAQRVGAPSRDRPRNGRNRAERCSKRQQHHAGLQRLAQPRHRDARLQCLSRGRMSGHRRHHLVFLARLFLFISRLPACQRKL